MTRAHHASVERCQQALLAGDLPLALRAWTSVPMFAESTHAERMRLLVALGDDAPGWLRARWLTVLAQRRVWSSDAGDREMRRATTLALHAVYPHGVPLDVTECEHPEQVLPALFGRDWVVRQLLVHEHGGLRDLLQHATPAALAGADDVAAWATAPMGGYRYEHTRDGVVDLVDQDDGSARSVLDLGLGELVEPGGHVIGRLVPTATDPGWVFEWQPLPVDRWTAKAVAHHPQDWLHMLAKRALDRRLPPGFSFLPECSLTADLPHQSWRRLLDLPVSGRQVEPPQRLLGRALRRALVLADEGRAGEHRHAISDLLLETHLAPRSRHAVARPEHGAAWRVLADELPALSAGRAAEMALWCDAAAP